MGLRLVPGWPGTLEVILPTGRHMRRDFFLQAGLSHKRRFFKKAGPAKREMVFLMTGSGYKKRKDE